MSQADIKAGRQFGGAQDGEFRSSLLEAKRTRLEPALWAEIRAAFYGQPDPYVATAALAVLGSGGADHRQRRALLSWLRRRPEDPASAVTINDVEQEFQRQYAKYAATLERQAAGGWVERSASLFACVF